MANKYIILLLVCLLLSLILIQGAKSELSPILQWSKTYPRPPQTTQDNLNITYIDGAYRILQTKDSGFVAVGNILNYLYRGTHSSGDYNYSAMLQKTDATGQLQFRKIDVNFSEPKAIFQNQDLGYTIITRECLLKTDEEGNINSNRNYDATIFGAAQIPNEGYIFSATNQRSGFIFKTDLDGNLLWNTTLFSFPSIRYGLCITNVEVAVDKGYFVAYGDGSVDDAIGKDFINLVIYKVGLDGSIQYTKSYSYDASQDQNIDPVLGKQWGYPATLQEVSVCATSDGGCVLFGGAVFNGGQFLAPFMVKLDSEGNWEWNKSYAQGNTVNSIFSSTIQTQGGFVAAGGYMHNSPGYRAPVFGLDAQGNFLWNHTFYSLNQYAWINHVISTKQGGFAAGGELGGDFFIAVFDLSPNNESLNNIQTMLVLAIVGVVVFCLAGIIIYIKKKSITQ